MHYVTTFAVAIPLTNYPCTVGCLEVPSAKLVYGGCGLASCCLKTVQIFQEIDKLVSHSYDNSIHPSLQCTYPLPI